MRTAAWEEDALCAQVGGQLFFPEAHEEISSAREVCRRCPVTRECLDLALEMERGSSRALRFGVWGGKSPRQRVALDRTARIDVSNSGESTAA